MSELNSKQSERFQPNDLGMRKSQRAGQTSIVVSQTAIDKAMVADSGHCMIAEAIKEAFPKAGFVSVDLATIRFTDRAAGFRYVFLTPRSAQVMLLQFDQGEKLEPITFRLGHPVQVIKTGSRLAKEGRNQSRSKREGVNTSAGNSVPVRLGGQAPPAGVLSNARGTVRVFGLRRAQPGVGAEK